MNNIVTIKTGTDRNSELVIHPEKAAAVGLENKKFACLCFGSQKHYVQIIMNSQISTGDLILSSNLIQELYLPDYPVYEIRVNQNEITIGPYIGLLFSQTDKKLTASRLKNMLVYVKEYTKLHGAIVVFTLNKADQANRLIEGYCYNPVDKQWQKGIFPYPSSIYRTIGLTAEWKNHFLSVSGDNIFNSRFFSKWETYQWFSTEPGINSYLPYTILYRSPQDVFEMLEKFLKIYIKPVLGLRGRGIARISMENQLFTFKYRENKVNHIDTFSDPSRVREYIQERFHPGKFLIQQAIDLIEYNEKIIDFRCIVQKNQSNLWVCKAIIGRLGVKGSIVSNISSGGAAFTVENILKRATQASEADIIDLKEKMADLAVTICNKLDEFGINCGTLGLDIGIDTQNQLWLVEINNRDPDPGIALDIHDIHLYCTLKSGPLYYAKLLAGFKDLNNNKEDLFCLADQQTI